MTELFVIVGLVLLSYFTVRKGTRHISGDFRSSDIAVAIRKREKGR